MQSLEIQFGVIWALCSEPEGPLSKSSIFIGLRPCSREIRRLQGLYLGCTRDMLLFLIAVTWIPWGVLSGQGRA